MPGTKNLSSTCSGLGFGGTHSNEAKPRVNPWETYMRTQKTGSNKENGPIDITQGGDQDAKET